MPATVTILVQQQGGGSAIADVKKDLGDLGSSAQDAGGGFSAMGEIATGALRAIGEMAVGAAIGGLKALGGAVMDGIADARENAKIQAQTAAVIKSTGGAAGVSAKQVADYASSLSAAAGKSLFGDDQIQQSENLLMTFTNISKGSLEAATSMSVDLAQAMGGAPKDAAIQLGKALNDPEKGITALTRIGVTFTDEQKDQIKVMQESGDMAGAQAVILAELNKEFGGSAEAAAKADGGMAQFKDRIGEAKEAIGTALLPLLGQMAGFLNDSIAPAVEAAAAAFGAWLANPATQAGIQAITDAIGVGLNAAFNFLTTTLIPALIAGWTALQPVFEVVRSAISGVAASFSDSSTPIQGFLDTLSRISPMFAIVRGIIEAALPPIQAIIMSVFGIISGFIQEHGAKIQSDLTAAWQAIQGLINALLPPIQQIVATVFGAIAAFLQAHGAEIQAFLGTTWDTIAQIIMLAVQLIQATIVPIFQAIASFLQAHGAEIQSILTIVWENIKGVINIALAIIKGVITAALAIVKGDWQGAWDAIKAMTDTVWANLKAIFTANLAAIQAVFIATWEAIKTYFQGVLASLVGWVLQTLQGIVNAISSFAGQAQAAAGHVGDGIVNGIVSGIESGVGAIIDAAKNAAMAALHAAMDALDMHSPSKVFKEQVGYGISEGIAEGITEKTVSVTSAVLDLVSKAIDVFASLGDGVTRVTGAALQSMMDNIYLLMVQFGELAEGFKGPFVDQAKAFAEAVSPVISVIKTAIDLFTDFPGVAEVTGSALQVLMNDLYLLIVQFGELAEGFGDEFIDRAKVFALALGDVLRIAGNALDVLNKLGSYSSGTGLNLFFADLSRLAKSIAVVSQLTTGTTRQAPGPMLDGGSNVADSYNRSVTFIITNNLSGTEGTDYSLAASLAGV